MRFWIPKHNKVPCIRYCQSSSTQREKCQWGDHTRGPRSFNNCIHWQLPYVLGQYPHELVLLSGPLLSLTTSSDSCSRLFCKCIFLVRTSSSIRCILRFDSWTCSGPFNNSRNFFTDSFSLEGGGGGDEDVGDDDVAPWSERHLYLLIHSEHHTFRNAPTQHK